MSERTYRSERRYRPSNELIESVKRCFAEHNKFRAALERIADLSDSEAGEPLDDAIRIAKKALLP